jgi:hypothetical protein
MIKKNTNKEVTIRIDENGNKDKMSYYELSRWLALVEGVHLIDEKMEEMKLPEDTNWVKQNALSSYVDERSPGLLYELTNGVI